MDYKISLPFVFPPIAQIVPQCVTQHVTQYVDRVFDSCYPLSKVTKVALCALGFLVVLYWAKLALTGRDFKPQAPNPKNSKDPTTEPDDLNESGTLNEPNTVNEPSTVNKSGLNTGLGFSEEIIALMGGESAFNQFKLMVIPNVTSKKKEPDPASKRWLIVYQLMRHRGDPFPAICLGKDEWDCPFIRVGYINTDNKKKGYTLIYSSRSSGELVWYVEGALFGPDNANKDVAFIRKLHLNIEGGFALDHENTNQ